MKNRFYFLGSLTNLVTLLVGMAFGFMAGTHFSGDVHAQVAQPVEEVSPLLATGSAAFGTLLAGRLAADEISVRGFDPIKFDENLLNLLEGKPFFSHAELQNLVDKSKSAKILRMKLEKPPEKPANPPSEKKP